MTDAAESLERKKRPRRKKKRRKKRSHRRIALRKIHPNSWNPNEMSPDFFRKLKSGIKRTLEEAGEIPPIVVRPSPETTGHYEIIDGFHRWKALTELKQRLIGVFVLKVSDKTARILTRTLNYLKGEPNRGRYAQGLVELIEVGASEEELEELLPESPDELEQLWEEAEVTIKAAENILAEDDEDEDEYSDKRSDDDIWVDVKFRVSVPQAEMVERELARIGGRLKGKAKRARALEYMAVQSSQTPLPEDMV